MKYIYILSGALEVIEVLKAHSERYVILEELLDTDLKSISVSKKLIPVSFNVSKIESKLRSLLIERISKPLDIPGYEGRFKEDELFVEMNVFGQRLKLCNTGFDNQVIFLGNLYNSVKKGEAPYHLLFTSNHREFRDWKLQQSDG